MKRLDYYGVYEDNNVFTKEDKKHGTPCFCMACGIQGLAETDFAEHWPFDVRNTDGTYSEVGHEGVCNICIKK